MKKIDFYEVCELIENSVFVDSTDEVRVSDDACSVRITSVGTIDEKGLDQVLKGEVPTITTQKPRELMFRF